MDLEQYRTLVEQAPTMIWRSGADGARTYVNARWLAFSGRPVERELGSGWTELLHPDDADACLATWRDHLRRREPFASTYRLRRFDGAWRLVQDRAAPVEDEAGAFAGFIGSCVELEERPSRLVTPSAEDIFELSLDNVCVSGLDGYFKRVNPSWTRTLGWSSEELLSRPVLEFVHPEDREGVLLAREGLRQGIPLHSLVNRYLCKDGTYRWFEWRSVSQPDQGLVYAVARDVTEQQRAEQRLREATELHEKLQRQLIFADRMASVGTLAAGVAHEINNPLAYVMANIELMIEDLRALGAASPSAALTDLVDLAVEAHSGAERIRKIVQGLKTFSRAEEEHRAVIEIEPLLELTIGMTANEIRQRGARLVRDYGALPPVEADEARLGQVFINLLINAAQALADTEGTADEIRIATSTDAAGRAVIEVHDSGIGIPARLLERIFDPFFTTKPVGIGTGLGLSICHNIVTGMGGELTVASEEGRGSRFRVVLPAATAR